MPATACTSSTMTVSTPAQRLAGLEVSMRNSDSGVVMRMSGGVPANAPAVGRRGVAGADRRRVMSGAGRPEPGGGVADADQRDAQVALDVDREGLHRRDVEHPAALLRLRGRRRSVASRSSAQRNADSVLPEPVGATTRAWSPELIASQAPSWAAVGALNEPSEPRRGRGGEPVEHVGCHGPQPATPTDSRPAATRQAGRTCAASPRPVRRPAAGRWCGTPTGGGHTRRPCG